MVVIADGGGPKPAPKPPEKKPEPKAADKKPEPKKPDAPAAKDKKDPPAPGSPSSSGDTMTKKQEEKAVQDASKDLLGHEASAAEVKTMTEFLQDHTVAQMRHKIQMSDEFKKKRAEGDETEFVQENKTAVQQTYEKILGRSVTADDQGFKDWVRFMNNGHTVAEMEAKFKKSSEYLQSHPDVAGANKGNNPMNGSLPPKAPSKPGKTGKSGDVNNVFDQAGVFVWHPDAFPAELAIQKLKESGAKWVALQISENGTLNQDTVKALDSGYIQKLKDAGFSVGLWGWHDSDNPEAEAKMVAEQVKKYGADFYIANAEKGYEYSQGQDAEGKPIYSPEKFARSQRFVDAFRQEMPDLPAALSSYGNMDRADLDWDAWKKAGFDYLPQTYLNETEIYDPKLAMEAAARHGWDAGRVHPTIGTYDSGARGKVSAETYVASMQAGGVHGFSTYLAETMSPEDWAVLGAAIHNGTLV